MTPVDVLSAAILVGLVMRRVLAPRRDAPLNPVGQPIGDRRAAVDAGDVARAMRGGR